jgi:hypothetical protein
MNLRALDTALSSVIALLAVTVIGLFFFEHCTGCTPAAPGPKLPSYCSSEPLYTAALLACVDKAETLSESKMCRETVDKTCGFTTTKRTP